MKNLRVNENLPQWILPCFIILAIYFIFTPGTRPEYPEASDAAAFIEDNKARFPKYEPIYERRVKGSNAYDCNDCHQHFLEPFSEGKQRTLVGEHTQILFKHGPDNLCFNCHNRENRLILKATDGSDLPFSRAVELCISCHGLRYRDWKLGLHGKTIGYWDPEKQTEKDRFQCLDCHDPHSPSVHDLPPAPVPHRPGPLMNGYADSQNDKTDQKRSH